MQQKNKEVLFLRLLNQCLFHKPRSTNMRGEEIILPEGRKPFPEANDWAVTLHPTETGMIYKRENIHSLVIKTVASRLLSWVKKWRDTKVNQVQNWRQRTENTCPSSDFVRKQRYLCLQLLFSSLCVTAVLLRDVSLHTSVSPPHGSMHQSRRSLLRHCPKYTGPQLFPLLQIRDEKHLSKMLGQILLPDRSLGRDSVLLGCHSCCRTMSWCCWPPGLPACRRVPSWGRGRAVPALPTGQLTVIIQTETAELYQTKNLVATLLF